MGAKKKSGFRFRKSVLDELTRMYPTIAAAALRLQADRVVIDGDIVALAPDGRPSFQALQHRLGSVSKLSTRLTLGAFQNESLRCWPE
jgi:ATP-dependent DNA ligase